MNRLVCGATNSLKGEGEDAMSTPTYKGNKLEDRNKDKLVFSPIGQYDGNNSPTAESLTKTKEKNAQKEQGTTQNQIMRYFKRHPTGKEGEKSTD